MIAHLKGVLASTGIDSAVIEVGGVGYLVGASTRTLTALGNTGEAVTVFTEMLVGEDFIRLVGFATAGERDWFRLLTGVQGVGARVGDDSPLRQHHPFWAGQGARSVEEQRCLCGSVAHVWRRQA